MQMLLLREYKTMSEELAKQMALSKDLTALEDLLSLRPYPMENIEHNAILNQMESKASFYHT
jgi:hypothetical protein